MNTQRFFAILFCIGIVFFSVWYVFFEEKKVEREPFTQIPVFADEIVLGEQNIRVAISDTVRTRVQGLSKTESLKDNQGMLFIFDEPDYYSFWMKEMKYPIDIIWFGANKEIVSIKENIDPSTYPRSFVSDKVALYVLEVPAGFVQTHKISLGMSFYFK